MTVTTEYIFPTQISGCKMDGFDDIKEPLIKWCYDYLNKDPNTKELSNRGGWQSSSKQVYHDEGFEPFKPLFSATMVKILKAFKLETNAQLMQLWVNINGPYSYNIVHSHPGSELSGCLWVQQSNEQGRFLFNNSIVGHRDAMLTLRTDKQYLHDYYMEPEYQPKYEDGTMLIFPSGLPHRVEQNLTNHNRISLAFNIGLTA